MKLVANMRVHPLRTKIDHGNKLTLHIIKSDDYEPFWQRWQNSYKRHYLVSVGLSIFQNLFNIFYNILPIIMVKFRHKKSSKFPDLISLFVSDRLQLKNYKTCLLAKSARWLCHKNRSFGRNPTFKSKN